MKRHVEFSIFLSLLLPTTAQDNSGRTNSPAVPQAVVFDAVQVNGPNGAADGHNAPAALQVKGGRGGDGGVNNINGGTGGGIRLRAGDGGGSSQDAGGGGDITLAAGNGGASSEVGAPAVGSRCNREGASAGLFADFRAISFWLSMAVVQSASAPHPRAIPWKS